jgi:hypothetical protein
MTPRTGVNTRLLPAFLQQKRGSDGYRHPGQCVAEGTAGISTELQNGSSGLVIESKDQLRKRLGRSPGKGDAVIMCLSAGDAAQRRSE